MKQLLLFATLVAFASAPAYAQVANSGTFGGDLAFLQKHKKVVVLKSDNDACQVVIVPDYQGRVMTSTAIEVKRDISILEKAAVEANLNIKLGPNTKYVGFQSVNDLKNTGQRPWEKKSGLLSIWILGMFNPSDETSIIIPYKNDLKLNSGYFGEVPKDRLMTSDKAVVFKGDGKLRSKIGLPPNNIVPVCGSYDATNNILTIVQYTFGVETDYVNSYWELQDKPYAGDVVNSRTIFCSSAPATRRK